MKIKNEYYIKYRVLTEWHNPYNTVTSNNYNKIVTATTAGEAVNNTLPSFSNPNKSVELISVEKI